MIPEGVQRGSELNQPDLLLDRLLPAGLTVLALAGTYRSDPLFSGLAATFLAMLLLARYWSRHALDCVEYERVLSADRAFPGDEVALTFRLMNRKWLPLPWIELLDAVPERLDPRAEDGEGYLEKGFVRLSAALGWHEQVSWRYRIVCGRRGIYSLGPAQLTSGDPLGISFRRTTIGTLRRLVVYPRLISVDLSQLVSDFPLGERNRRRWIFEDPSRVAGVRDYRLGDSLRRIHWKASARRPELQSKAYEPTTMLEVVLFLAADSLALSASGDDESFEFAVSVAASLSRELIEEGHPVGLYASVGSEVSGPVAFAPAAGEEQLIRILESLAGIERSNGTPSELQLAEVASSLPWGASVVVLAGEISQPLSGIVERLRSSGRRVEIVRVDAIRTGSANGD